MMMIMWKYVSSPHAHQGSARQEHASLLEEKSLERNTISEAFNASYEVDFTHADDMWELHDVYY